MSFWKLWSLIHKFLYFVLVSQVAVGKFRLAHSSIDYKYSLRLATSFRLHNGFVPERIYTSTVMVCSLTFFGWIGFFCYWEEKWGIKSMSMVYKTVARTVWNPIKCNEFLYFTETNTLYSVDNLVQCCVGIKSIREVLIRYQETLEK